MSNLVLIDELVRDCPDGMTIEEGSPPGTAEVIAIHRDGTIHVIPIEKAKELDLAQYPFITTLQTKLTKGASTRDLFKFDLAQVQRFLDLRVSPHPEGRWVQVHNWDEPDYIILRNFPLADGFVDDRGQYQAYKPDFEAHIVVVIAGYPDVGPWGVYISKKSSNREAIRAALHGHIYDRAIGAKYEVKTLEERHRWLCFHFARPWKFNAANLLAGDCLTKYVIALYAALSGGFKDA